MFTSLQFSSSTDQLCTGADIITLVWTRILTIPMNGRHLKPKPHKKTFMYKKTFMRKRLIMMWDSVEISGEFAIVWVTHQPPTKQYLK
jgi:hypothetical protein